MKTLYSFLPVNCTAGKKRIVNNFSNDQFSGRVEICVNGKWGSICDDGWGLNEAHVVCSQFGYTDYGKQTGNALDIYMCHC